MEPVSLVVGTKYNAVMVLVFERFTIAKGKPKGKMNVDV
jgi:hypothetical protein